MKSAKLNAQDVIKFGKFLFVLFAIAVFGLFIFTIKGYGDPELRLRMSLNVNVEDLKEAMVVHQSANYNHLRVEAESQSQSDTQLWPRNSTDSESSESENYNIINETSFNNSTNQVVAANDDDKLCMGKYVYIYDLPSEFNEDLIDKCGRSPGSTYWVPLCGNLENNGYGPDLASLLNIDSTYNNNSEATVLQPLNKWFNTEQFSVEVIFHNRLKSHPCLTKNPQIANAFYIPFYPALDTAFTLFSPALQVRDRLSQRLFGWLRGNPVWTEFGPSRRRHFMVLGRVTWDFSRAEDALDGWGTSLFNQFEMSNVTKLLIERKFTSDEVGIPYPTSFHPSSVEDVNLWQDKVKQGMESKKWVCSFIGSKRGNKWSQDLREALASQCEKGGNETCKHAKCGAFDPLGNTIDCIKHPDHVTTLFLDSTFCLQPPGDTPTRKGLFDSLIAGCIPVFFSRDSAYRQYLWHLPQNESLYSIFFDGDGVINQKVDVVASLVEIAKDKERIRLMQEQIVNMIPNLVYAMPEKNHSSASFHDAVDVALDNILSGVTIATFK